MLDIDFDNVSCQIAEDRITLGVGSDHLFTESTSPKESRTILILAFAPGNQRIHPSMQVHHTRSTALHGRSNLWDTRRAPATSQHRRR